MSNPTIKKRVCDRCGKEFFETYREWLCKDCMNDLGWEYTPKTNADHIRSMTDEELATFHLLQCPYMAGFYGECKYGWHDREQSCEECMLEWLKQPYGGDT